MSLDMVKSGRARPSITFRLIPSYILVAILSVAPMVWYGLQALDQMALQGTVEELKAQATLIRAIIEKQEDSWLVHEIGPTIEDLSSKLENRITVILPNGKVIADSDKAPGKMENHSNRLEIREALKGRVGVSNRFSDTLSRRMVYVALPIGKPTNIKAVIRTSMPMAEIDLMTKEEQFRIGLVGLMIICFAAGICLVVAQKITAPFKKMKEGAMRFASGELDYRIEVSDTEEVAAAAEAMNNMAHELRQRMNMITEQRNQLEVILSNMVEGVIVLDESQKVTKINRAAAKIFQIDLETAEGRSLIELVRNTDLLYFASRTLAQDERQEGLLTLRGATQSFFLIRGAALKDANGNITGALLVLEDVTEIKEVERMRRDFVVNASHELRTPATAIRGFVDTLLDGALDEKETSERFLGIISKHTDRLISIIENLKLIAQTQNMESKEPLDKDKTNLKEFLSQVADDFTEQASKKGCSIEVSSDEDIDLEINIDLMRQALGRIISNGIESTKPNTKVTLEARRWEKEIIIDITDQGAGIGKEDLPRVFERFYRTDSGRSRNFGGSGLGLTIAKYIVKAHGGQINVDSTLGKGSVFSIHLPS